MVAPLCAVARTFLSPRRRGNIPSNWCSKLCSCVLSCPPHRRGNLPSNWCSKFAVAYSLARPTAGGISHPTGVPSCVVAYFLARPVARLSHPAGKDNQPGIKRMEPLVPSHWGEKVSFCTFCAATIPAKSPRPHTIYRRSVPRKIKYSLCICLIWKPSNRIILEKITKLGGNDIKNNSHPEGMEAL